MLEPRKRRIVRRIVLSVAAPLLLISWYLGSYLVLHGLYGGKMVTAPQFFRLREAIYAPADYYMNSYFLGAKTMRRMSRWCLLTGDKGKPPEWSRTDDPGWYW